MCDPRHTPADWPAWDSATLRDPHQQADKADRVRAMFNAVAPTYECINRLATFGRDAAWRRRAVAAARVRAGDIVLDIACGTGDMIRAFARATPAPGRLIGVDFAGEMLRRGDYGGVRVPVDLLEADALHLPLPEASVDVISCAFGVRNFQDVEAGLREMARVARPGARLVVLEFALPTNRLARWLYRRYCHTVLPGLGRLIAGDRMGAYRYLPRSVQTFESPAALAQRMEAAGFGSVRTTPMNLGGVVLYSARRAEVAAPDGTGGRT